ncbi:MAG: energy transducer TonB, partial [Proteobacteria bacterium]|nr:energy transducer TonB [Pseudomonadota bacterium]
VVSSSVYQVTQSQLLMFFIVLSCCLHALVLIFFMENDRLSLLTPSPTSTELAPLTTENSDDSVLDDAITIVDVIQQLDTAAKKNRHQLKSHQDHQVLKEMVIPKEKIKHSGRGDQIGDNRSMTKSESKSRSYSPKKAGEPSVNEVAALAKPFANNTTKKLSDQPYAKWLEISQDVIKKNQGFSAPAYVDMPNVARGNRVQLNTQKYYQMSYFAKMRDTIQSVWDYPELARMKEISGNVRVRFVIDRDGVLQTAQVVESSGFDILDNEVIDSLRDASPFDPLPSGWQETNLDVTGVFSYTLFQ